MKKLNLSELKVKSKSGKSKTWKRRKRRDSFSAFSTSDFSILSIRPISKSQKKKSWKKTSKISEVSEVSEFLNWPMIHSVFNQLFVKILITLNLLRSGEIKIALFPETGRVKNFLSLTHPHSQICIRIYIFNFKKQTNKQKNKTRIQRKAKETKEEKIISPQRRLKKQICGRPMVTYKLWL